jgi:hypothetical protein
VVGHRNGTAAYERSSAFLLCPISTISRPRAVRWRAAWARIVRVWSSPSAPLASAIAGSLRYSSGSLRIDEAFT